MVDSCDWLKNRTDTACAGLIQDSQRHDVINGDVMTFCRRHNMVQFDINAFWIEIHTSSFGFICISPLHHGP